MSYKPTGRPVGRPRIFYADGVPASVAKLVSAFCADLPRRESVISSKDTDERVLRVYRHLDEAIFNSLTDVEESLRGAFLSDIAENRGYGQSLASKVLSYKAYYNRKRQVIYNIARYLDLV